MCDSICRCLVQILQPAYISHDYYSKDSFTFINTTYDISLDSQISLLPLGFSLHSKGIEKKEENIVIGELIKGFGNEMN